MTSWFSIDTQTDEITDVNVCEEEPLTARPHVGHDRPRRPPGRPDSGGDPSVRTAARTVPRRPPTDTHTGQDTTSGPGYTCSGCQVAPNNPPGQVRVPGERGESKGTTLAPARGGPRATS